MTKEELLKDLFVKYGLVYDKNNPESKDNDVYIHKFYKTITRSGIQKIERAANIKIKFYPIAGSCGVDYATVHALGSKPDGQEYETFASANAQNCKNGYYAEMAEKRARSRIVLTLEGLYQQGFYGKDEMSSGDEKEEPQVVKKTLFQSVNG